MEDVHGIQIRSIKDEVTGQERNVRMLDPETDNQLKEILSKMVSPESQKKNPVGPGPGPSEKPKFSLNLNAVQ